MDMNQILMIAGLIVAAAIALKILASVTRWIIKLAVVAALADRLNGDVRTADVRVVRDSAGRRRSVLEFTLDRRRSTRTGALTVDGRGSPRTLFLSPPI